MLRNPTDGAPMMAPAGYPVDDITEMTHCELHVKVVNISMKVAVGYALPIGPTPTYHCRPVPEGYAVVGVDEIMPTFEVLYLHYPAGEGDVTVLGDATNSGTAITAAAIFFASPGSVASPISGAAITTGAIA